nr:galactoside alpha-(1,2)-fucosyltransferase 2 [Parasteatoda tepidariorum]
MDIGQLYKILYVLAILSCACFVIFYLIPYENSEGETFRAPPPLVDALDLTIHTNQGRLGNQMFTYATLFGLSALNKRHMQIKTSNYEVLSKYFDIQTPVFNEKTFVEINPYSIGNWLKEKDYHIPITSNIIKGNVYPTSYTFFDHVRKEIREVFRFNPTYRKHAQDVLWGIKRQRPHTKVYVGVHVRRGDYLSHSRGGWLRGYEGREVDREYFERAILLRDSQILAEVHVRRGDYLSHSRGGWLRGYEGREVDREYFERAMEYFNFKYDNVTFLAISDDRDWCRKNLTDLGIVTTPDSPSAGHDLALLTECNHTIMSYGTYGFWGGYLGGGEVVYFADFLKPNTSFVRDYFVYEKMYPTDWIGISTTKPGFWESYTNPFMT